MIFYTNRKDELLRNYERDLAKLRQAELLVAKKSEQVEELVVSPVNYSLGILLVCHKQQVSATVHDLIQVNCMRLIFFPAS